jgi:hypothetical protein
MVDTLRTTQAQGPPQRRVMPQSELDMNMMMTDTVYGSGIITPELQDLLSKEYAIVDDKGQVITDSNGKPALDKRSLWGLMGYYTRDLRLANLDPRNNEVFYAQYYLDLAGDCLKEGYIQAFLVCLSRVATLLELSQSKNGFLRKQTNTFRTESSQEILDPPKKGLFGVKKKEG